MLLSVAAVEVSKGCTAHTTIFAAAVLIGAKQSAFSTNHLI